MMPRYRYNYCRAKFFVRRELLAAEERNQNAGTPRHEGVCACWVLRATEATEEDLKECGGYWDHGNWIDLQD
jgi:hypothetical protein